MATTMDPSNLNKASFFFHDILYTCPFNNGFIHLSSVYTTTSCMKKIFILGTIMCCYSLLSAQPQKVKGQVASTDTADLSILNVYPSTFPDVSVVFRAETRKGEPVWNLSKEKMRVTENGRTCDVISLDHLSANKPIVLGVVIDHSGSMGYIGVSQSYTITTSGNVSDTVRNVIDSGSSPIDSAKKAVKNFVKSFNAQKDKISVIGFSDIVDVKLPATQDLTKVNLVIDSMQATLSTALYDAMITGLDEIKAVDGVRVLAVLTDGQDNASKNKWQDVVDKANKENIPVYIIGLSCE
jgi:Ca-activated chloride channel family protein